jgi:hypothetical protein
MKVNGSAGRYLITEVAAPCFTNVLSSPAGRVSSLVMGPVELAALHNALMCFFNNQAV